MWGFSIKHYCFLGLSSITRYDWTTISDAEKDPEVTYSVQMTVAPHKTMSVHQVVGKCGGNTIYTRSVVYKEQDISK